MTDDAALRRCERRGFGDGVFYLDTCHRVQILGIWPAGRCVESNRFERRLPMVEAGNLPG